MFSVPASNRVQPQRPQRARPELPRQLRLPASGSSRPDSSQNRGEPDPRLHQHRGHQRVRSPESWQTPDISFITPKSTWWTFVLHVHLNMGCCFFFFLKMSLYRTDCTFQTRLLFYKNPGLRKKPCWTHVGGCYFDVSEGSNFDRIKSWGIQAKWLFLYFYVCKWFFVNQDVTCLCWLVAIDRQSVSLSEVRLKKKKRKRL